eukprot:GEZU01001726.1.p1 GENE.GEZU01001726.1~~GEZU01001726.1.p1  ORF type:complete len:351 (+),score=71.38 GEZU01001726.1:94-1053(+)
MDDIDVEESAALSLEKKEPSTEEVNIPFFCATPEAAAATLKQFQQQQQPAPEFEHEEHVARLLSNLSLAGIENKTLDLSFTAISDEDLEGTLKVLEDIIRQDNDEQQNSKVGLRVLDLQSCSALKNPRIASKTLEQLNLSRTAVSIEAIHYTLWNCPNLRRLSLKAITSADTEQLNVRHATLEELDLSELRVSNSVVLNIISQCPNMRKLSLRSCTGLRNPPISNCPALYELDVMGIDAADMSDECIGTIQATSPNLQFIWYRKRLHPSFYVKDNVEVIRNEFLQKILQSTMESSKSSAPNYQQIFRKKNYFVKCPCCW